MIMMMEEDGHVATWIRELQSGRWNFLQSSQEKLRDILLKWNTSVIFLKVFFILSTLDKKALMTLSQFSSSNAILRMRTMGSLLPPKLMNFPVTEKERNFPRQIYVAHFFIHSGQTRLQNIKSYRRRKKSMCIVRPKICIEVLKKCVCVGGEGGVNGIFCNISSMCYIILTI